MISVVIESNINLRPSAHSSPSIIKNSLIKVLGPQVPEKLSEYSSVSILASLLDTAS